MRRRRATRKLHHQKIPSMSLRNHRSPLKSPRHLPTMVAETHQQVAVVMAGMTRKMMIWVMAGAHQPTRRRRRKRRNSSKRKKRQSANERKRKKRQSANARKKKRKQSERRKRKRKLLRRPPPPLQQFQVHTLLSAGAKEHRLPKTMVGAHSLAERRRRGKRGRFVISLA